MIWKCDHALFLHLLKTQSLVMDQVFKTPVFGFLNWPCFNELYTIFLKHIFWSNFLCSVVLVQQWAREYQKVIKNSENPCFKGRYSFFNPFLALASGLAKPDFRDTVRSITIHFYSVPSLLKTIREWRIIKLRLFMSNPRLFFLIFFIHTYIYEKTFYKTMKLPMCTLYIMERHALWYEKKNTNSLQIEWNGCE